MKTLLACLPLWILCPSAQAGAQVVLGSANGPIAEVALEVLREAYQRIGVELVVTTVATGRALGRLLAQVPHRRGNTLAPPKPPASPGVPAAPPRGAAQ